MTTRNLSPEDFEHIAIIVDKAVQISKKVEEGLGGSKKFKDFADYLGDGKSNQDIETLKKEVKEWVENFPVSFTFSSA